MASWMMPDKVFEHYYDIEPRYLLSLGIKALIIDIDNTLAPYEQDVPDERIVSWLDSLAENGISASFVSNNEWERVQRFNEKLGLPAYAKSGKPFAKNLRRAMERMGSDVTNTAMLGDQLLTDVCAGKHIGLRVFLVPPIKDRTSAFFRFKRTLEVGTIKKSAAKSKDAAGCEFWLGGKYKKTN